MLRWRRGARLEKSDKVQRKLPQRIQHKWTTESGIAATGVSSVCGGKNKRANSQRAIKRGVQSSEAALVAPVLVEKLNAKLGLVRAADSRQVVSIEPALRA
jgi:hypothetical protein